MILPRKPVPGEPVTAQLIGRMIDYMRRITPLRGNGVLTQATPGGTVISALPSPAAPAGVGPFPFEVQAVDVPGTGGSAAQTVLAIYTPEGVLCVDNAVVSSIDTATAVASQGDGWYSYAGVVPPTSGQQTQIWLSVSWPAGTASGSPTATIGTSAGSGSSSSIVRSVLLAKAARSSSGLLTVSQFAYSALAFWRPFMLSGTVEFMPDADWYVNGSVHVLRKRLRELDLATGQVTDKANTTYGNGWEVMANSTPISSIINQASSS